MNALIFITVTGGMLAHSLLDIKQSAKNDLFYRADHKTVADKKCCCNQAKIARIAAAKKPSKV